MSKKYEHDKYDTYYSGTFSKISIPMMKYAYPALLAKNIIKVEKLPNNVAAYGYLPGDVKEKMEAYQKQQKKSEPMTDDQIIELARKEMAKFWKEGDFDTEDQIQFNRELDAALNEFIEKGDINNNQTPFVEALHNLRTKWSKKRQPAEQIHPITKEKIQVGFGEGMAYRMKDLYDAYNSDEFQRDLTAEIDREILEDLRKASKSASYTSSSADELHREIVAEIDREILEDLKKSSKSDGYTNSSKIGNSRPQPVDDGCGSEPLPYMNGGDNVTTFALRSKDGKLVSNRTANYRDLIVDWKIAKKSEVQNLKSSKESLEELKCYSYPSKWNEEAVPSSEVLPPTETPF